MGIRRSLIALTLLSTAQCAAPAFGFSGNYHEALARRWWEMHGQGSPSPANGGIHFILASSAADIRGTSMGVKPLRSFPDAWNRINGESFHTEAGAKEFMAKILAARKTRLTIADVLEAADAASLESGFVSGKTLSAVAIHPEHRWIARGWALHNLTDYIGRTCQILDTSGEGGRFLPEDAQLDPPGPGDSAMYLDNWNDARSALWVGLADVDPQAHREITAVFSSPEKGGRLLADFAFVLQRGYDRCGADSLGISSGLERAQRVMLPVMNEFAHGITVPLLGRTLSFGWGMREQYTAREQYAREVALPELYREAELRAP